MLLSDLFIHLNINVHFSKDVVFKRVCLHHEFVREASVFIALSGDHNHGKAYIEKAIQKGACAILLEDIGMDEKTYLCELNNQGIPLIKGNNFSTYLTLIASLVYRFDRQSIKLVGVTGTNGKTSALFHAAQLLEIKGIRPYLISTLGVGMINNLVDYEMTTPDVLLLYEHIHTACEQQCDVVLIEASSHGIAQGRIDDLVFDVGVLTSLDYDHIDYHQTYENYLNTKLKLLEKSRSRLRIVNFDIPEMADWYADQLSAKDVLSFSISPNESVTRRFDHKFHMAIKQLNLSVDGIDGMAYLYLPKSRFDHISFSANLYGKFQAQSLIVAYLIVCALALDYENIPADLEDVLSTLPGRMQCVEYSDSNDSFKVFVDYAHTPNALESVLTSTNKHFRDYYVIVVFGCGGDRYQAKRPLMGEIARRLADYVILTDDNPRSEDPKAIVDHILSGMSDTHESIHIEHDRQSAIEKAIQFGIGLDDNIVVLIAGRGHETKQYYHNRFVYLNDYDVALNAIEYYRK